MCTNVGINRSTAQVHFDQKLWRQCFQAGQVLTQSTGKPAFSRCIRGLEVALGLILVSRSRSPVELTAFGQAAFGHGAQQGLTTRRVLASLASPGRWTGRGHAGGCHTLPGTDFSPRWIAQLCNEWLNIATRLAVTASKTLVHALRDNSGCDLILTFYDPDAALQIDLEILPSSHLANTEMQPVLLATRRLTWQAKPVCRC